MLLLKCPFCGEFAQLLYPIDQVTSLEKGYQVRCENCYCGTGTYNTPQSAIDAWNRRTDVPSKLEDDGRLPENYFDFEV